MTRTLNCSCGAMEWQVADTAQGTHLKCYCADCQTAARHLGHADMLEDGGTHIFHTLPADLQITKGAEHLALIRLSPKGLMRWHAGCCNTPIAATLPKTGFPFIGLVLPPDNTSFGKVQAHAFTQSAPKRIRQRGMGKVAMGIFARALRAYATGQRENPLLQPDGTPQTAPKILTKQERNAARP